MRVLEYRSRPGLGVCGQGMHYHPDHVTVSLTGAKLKVTTPDGKVTFEQIPAGHVFFAPAETHSAEVIGGSGNPLIHHRVEGQGLEAEHGLR